MHRSKKVLDYMESKQIPAVFNPAYYPDGNPIEYAFNVVKQKYKKQVLYNILNEKKTDVEEELKKAFESLKKE